MGENGVPSSPKFPQITKDYIYSKHATKPRTPSPMVSKEEKGVNATSKAVALHLTRAAALRLYEAFRHV